LAAFLFGLDVPGAAAKKEEIDLQKGNDDYL
jgi:hypothetical protein